MATQTPGRLRAEGVPGGEPLGHDLRDGYRPAVMLGLWRWKGGLRAS